jgi:ABC-type sugar transport system ATPase subunit
MGTALCSGSADTTLRLWMFVGGPLRLVDQRRMWTESEIYLKRLGLAISPKTLVRELSIAQQQMVEIAKALVDCS